MRCVIFVLISAFSAIAGQFSTAIGDQYPYVISAITTDSADNTYAVGIRRLDDQGTPLTTPTYAPTSQDVFVTKLDPNGKLLFTRTFGGDGVTNANAVAVDPTGNIYIAGSTSSDDFPVTNALQPNPCSCGFIIKLSGDGKTILYSTHFGGQLGGTSIAAVATDAKGNLYLTGTSNASDFPHTPGMPFGPLQFQSSTSSETFISGAFITSISAAGDKILYSGALSNTTTTNCFNDHLEYTCLSITTGVGIRVDPAGNAYIIGATDASNLGTPGVLLPSLANGGQFIAKVGAGGTGVSYLTYLNANASGIAVDASGSVYLGGYSGGKFPVTSGAYQTGFIGGSFDGLVVKLNPAATAIVWATYLGGGNGGGSAAIIYSLALDSSGNVWTTGLAAEGTIPNTNGFANVEAFVTALNPAGSALVYSARYPRGTVEQSIAVDGAGVAHVAGSNGFISAVAPSAAPVTGIFGLQNAFGGSITQRIAPAEVIAIYGTELGPASAATAAPSNGFYPTTLGGTQVSINGTNVPLLHVSANQIDAVVPMGVSLDSGAVIHVTTASGASAEFPVWIVYSAPQAYPGVLNQDGSLNSQSNPAKFGSVVSVYVTGLQTSFAPLADGQVATAALDLCGGVSQASSGMVVYGGAAPGIVAGISQFNVRMDSFPSATLAFVGLSNIPPINAGQAPVSVDVWVTP